MPHQAAPTDLPIAPEPCAVPKPPRDDEPPQRPVPVHKEPPAPDLPARPAGPAKGRPQPPRIPSPVPLQRQFGTREERHKDAYERYCKWRRQEKECTPLQKARRRGIEEEVRPLAREGDREVGGGVALRVRPPLEPAVERDRQPITLEESLRMLQDLCEQLEKEKDKSHRAVRALDKAKRDLGRMEVRLCQALSDCQDAMVKATDKLIRLT